MSLIKDLYRTFKQNSLKQYKEKPDFKGKGFLPWNIYNVKMQGSAMKTFFRVHLNFKSKLFQPLLLLSRYFFRGEFEVDIPDEPHNVNMKVFNDSYEQAVNIWYEYYLPHKIGFEIDEQKVLATKKLNTPNCMLRVMKKLFFKIVLNDTVYREFLNIFAHEFARGMLNEHKGKTVKHLFYTNKSIYDVNYYIISKVIQDIKFKDELIIKMEHMGGGKK